MKLSQTMELVSVDKKMYDQKHPIESESVYRFWVNNEFYVILEVMYRVIGQTVEANIPVVNFGYRVWIEKHDVKRGIFSRLLDVDVLSGKATKEYFSNRGDRGIVRKIVVKSLRHYLRDKNPPVLLRGPMNTMIRILPRYLAISEILIGHAYEQLIFHVNQMPKELWMANSSECAMNDEVWVYVNDTDLWKQLNGWLAI